MNEPSPFPKLIHAGDFVMLPITGGPEPLPATWWTANGEFPGTPDVANPSYAIAMGKEAQVHMFQECVDANTIRIFAAFVDEVEVNLQGQRVDLFPYAQFDISECGDYTADLVFPINKRIFAYCPAGRVKPITPSEPLTSMEPGGEQFRKLFG